MGIEYFFFFFFACEGTGARVLATGGASGNKSLLQVLSDVFNAPVYTMVCFYTCLLC